METSRAVRAAAVRELRPVLRRVGLVLGVGFLALVVVPVSIAVVVALTGGPGRFALGFLAFGVLGFLLVLAAVPVAMVGVAWVLVGSLTATLESTVTDRRRRVLRWAETVEETRWWGPLVRPTERLSFVDPLTAEERFEAELARAKAAYVSGALSETAFEGRLDRLLGIEVDGSSSVGFEPLVSNSPSALGAHRREVAPGERADRRDVDD